MCHYRADYKSNNRPKTIKKTQTELRNTGRNTAGSWMGCSTPTFPAPFALGKVEVPEGVASDMGLGLFMG